MTAFERFTGQEPAGGPRCYRIVRHRFKGAPRTIRNGLTLAEAQAHCQRKDTHGGAGTSRWFDGYDYMRGCKPDTD
jgi:hypothetical protein